MESANSTLLAGQTITFSFYAKRTSGAGALDVRFYYPSAVDNFASITQIGSTVVVSASPSSSWTRYSVTAAIGTNITAGLQILINNTGAATTFITGAQLELGNVATSFSRAGATIEGELAACQRYYWRWNASTQFATAGTGAAVSSTVACVTAYHPVPMRAIVSAIDGSANSTFRLQDQVTGFTQTAASIETTQEDLYKTELNITVASGLTQYRFLRYGANNSTSAYLGFSAEL
jgi:hypothetical protein